MNSYIKGKLLLKWFYDNELFYIRNTVISVYKKNLPLVNNSKWIFLFKCDNDEFLYYDNSVIRNIEGKIVIFPNSNILNKYGNYDIYQIKCYSKTIKYTLLVEKIRNDIYLEFNSRYFNIMKKIYLNLIPEIKLILIDHINNLDSFIEYTNDKNYLYYMELTRDLKFCYNNLNEKKLLRPLYNINYKKIIDGSIYKNPELHYKFLVENKDKFIFKIMLEFYKSLKDNLNIVKYKWLSSHLEEYGYKWNDIKHGIYDKKIIEKFQYLEDASKFDLI